MWQKIKSIYRRIFLILVALGLIVFMFIVGGALLIEISKGKDGTFDLITIISLAAIGLSLPGVVNSIADEFNPKKKRFKLSANCPKCKHRIQMNMEEE